MGALSYICLINGSSGIFLFFLDESLAVPHEVDLGTPTVYITLSHSTNHYFAALSADLDWSLFG